MDQGIGVKSRAKHAFLEHVGNRYQDHSLMMRHIGPYRHDGHVLGQSGRE